MPHEPLGAWSLLPGVGVFIGVIYLVLNDRAERVETRQGEQR